MDNLPTDAELWRRAVDGDTEAFGVIFDRHARAVYNHCFRRTADWSEAEDITSVVFLEAWRRHGELSPERDSALPWLLGVANNVLRNRYRAKRSHRDALDRMPALSAEPDPADDIAGRIDDEHQMRRVLVAVNRLPLADQEILSLCVWAGLSYDDAAIALGLSVGTVRSRLSRARVRLRELTASFRGEARELPAGTAHRPGERHTALRPPVEES
ncbi:RNA polymerase sigma factor [Nonomuraea rhodomycinica]|uniref:Sigma-70 family RNA polymerase sigma factor n=1 Tax=Nonomuraea rhodomycinica TaxID=1712872 RepID=A0A7Y6MCD4_9ACTN|nr:sigma-70 family RNA polymerase sigma factor [Nonomuraea rhodomycinica]NUW41810.1 sigma-70 family RNA polymerase sigma factor [Nonomuraea rhodomycinica]